MNRTWFRLFRRRGGPRPARGFRPSLEGLEERAAPALATPTAYATSSALFLPIQTALATYSGLTPNPPLQSGQVYITYTPLLETETVILNGLSPGTGAVSISDAGQIHTVGVSPTGVATTTFSFNLLLANAGAHTIGVSAAPSPGGQTFSTSLAVPDTTALQNNVAGFSVLLATLVLGGFIQGQVQAAGLAGAF
jgi:hypothetical protein